MQSVRVGCGREADYAKAMAGGARLSGSRTGQTSVKTSVGPGRCELLIRARLLAHQSWGLTSPPEAVLLRQHRDCTIGSSEVPVRRSACHRGAARSLAAGVLQRKTLWWSGNWKEKGCMLVDRDSARQRLLEGLNDEQRGAVSSLNRQLMVIAGAGSGKTEVMARRVAWWVAVDQVPKDRIVAFTFTDAAAEELKFRIRNSLLLVSSEDDVTLGGMFVGTIHAFCLKALREFAPVDYYMYDVLDEAGRISLLEQGGFNVLGMNAFTAAAQDAGLASGAMAAKQLFRDGYDQLNEHGLLDVRLGSELMPSDVRLERDWCMEASLCTPRWCI